MDKNFNYSNLKLGIIGGGQLGKIMSQKAKKMGFHVTILDPTFNCPAAQVSDKHIMGGFHDKEKLEQLVQESDVTTFELEHVDTSILKELFDNGHNIHPSPYVIELIQNKYEQKKLLDERGIPVPAYKNVESDEDLASFGFPVIQKAKREGYDGKGVLMLKTPEDIKNAIKSESFIEELVDIDKELAIIVARNMEGEIKCYPVVEMLFDDRTNICDIVMAPAKISKEIEEKAIEICVKSIKVLDGVGIFGVELFLTKSGEILVNEIAPRPHNSGHYTVEACATSQFEQMIRAVTNLPLGSTKLLSASVMINILGEEGYEGEPFIDGIHEALEIPELSFHFYGKSFTKPFRKMGHITVLDDDIDKALEKAMRAKDIFKNQREQANMSKPLIGIIMGSDSDLPVMSAAAQMCEESGIDFEIDIVSAHRTPGKLVEYAASAEKRGLKVIIAGAGGAAHLPGMVASETVLPVIGVPVRSSSLDGMDSLLSIVQMPGGVPVATVAINGAKNAGILAAQIIGSSDSSLREKIAAYKNKIKNEVEQKSEKLQKIEYKKYLEEMQK